MEDLIVDIKLWGQMVGSLVWDNATGMAVFEYDNSFRHN
jgi:serine/threonine-protein kinase HipA